MLNMKLFVANRSDFIIKTINLMLKMHCRADWHGCLILGQTRHFNCQHLNRSIVADCYFLHDHSTGV
jgi:hypothetical protein